MEGQAQLTCCVTWGGCQAPLSLGVLISKMELLCRVALCLPLLAKRPHCLSPGGTSLGGRFRRRGQGPPGQSRPPSIALLLTRRSHPGPLLRTTLAPSTQGRKPSCSTQPSSYSPGPTEHRGQPVSLPLLGVRGLPALGGQVGGLCAPPPSLLHQTQPRDPIKPPWQHATVSQQRLREGRALARGHTAKQRSMTVSPSLQGAAPLPVPGHILTSSPKNPS